MKRIAAIVAIAAALLSTCAVPGARSSAPEAATPAAAASEPAPSPSPLPAATEPAATVNMTVTSPGIVSGFIDPAYGSHGKMKDGVPVISIPLEILDAPESTACFALYVDDPDSEPLCGYRWVHWMIADFTETSLPEGFSAAAGDKAAQGTNDFGTIGYGGPTPPDKDHKYVITVYALDGKTGLKDGFSKEEFKAAVKGHVLAEATLEGIYRK